MTVHIPTSEIHYLWWAGTMETMLSEKNGSHRGGARGVGNGKYRPFSEPPTLGLEAEE